MSDLSVKLATIVGLTMTSKHIGLTSWDESNPKMLADEWRITLSYIRVGEDEKTRKEYSTTYRTGIGHRKMASGVRKERGGYTRNDGVPLVMEEACHHGFLIPVKPNIADVVSCLMCDASSGMETFQDWCYNMSANIDSRSDLDTYLRCQDILVNLRKMFGYSMLDELMKLDH